MAKAQKAEKTGGVASDGYVVSELSQISQIVNNIEMMHSENQGALKNLMDHTERLNDSITQKFTQFR